MVRVVALAVVIVVLVVLASLAGCGGRGRSAPIAATAAPHLASAGDRILALLPDHAQVVIELDLARLRANPIVGEVVRRALETAFDDRLPAGVPSSPLAKTDVLVLAAYGVGTAQAATITVLATTAEVEGGRRLAPDLVALGPAEWLDQLEVRGAIAGVTASPALLALRDHAMPAAAPGASLRITARLPFDARIALARQTGLESAPGQLSIWGDVVDDLAIIVDADAVDPGDRKIAESTKRLAILVRGALAALAEEPAIRALGIPPSLLNARLVAQGSWVRAIIAIGPARLQRAVDRAKVFLAVPAASPDSNATEGQPTP